MKSILGISVNGRQRQDAVADNMLQMDYLREVLSLTGTKQGCDGGECGACTVLVDGEPRLACCTLAHSVAGRNIETIEGVSRHGNMSALQRAFHEHLGSQCGFAHRAWSWPPRRCCARTRHPPARPYAPRWRVTFVGVQATSRSSSRSKRLRIQGSHYERPRQGNTLPRESG